MKFDNQLRYAINIIGEYGGDIPLAAWLKNFFRENRQMGSRDRKSVAELVYAYYRGGHALKQLTVDERILALLFLSGTAPNEILQYFRPDLNERIQVAVEEKAAFLEMKYAIPFSFPDIFPWSQELSAGMNAELYCRSFLVQPDVFLRIRPGYENVVREKLQTANISYYMIAENCIALKNGVKADEVLQFDREVVVQDINSQQVGNLFAAPLQRNERQPTVWDSCAASGGKSIMAYDINPAIQLTVSDVRPSILHNLQNRFQRAGIKNYRHFIADLSKPVDESALRGKEKFFDLIIADLPCTGSGTWSRTPEQLYFFKEEKIAHYSSLQKKIVKHLVPFLKQGGVLVYITCSVFRKENEEVAECIEQEGNLKAETLRLLTGYEKKADTLFAARFT